MTKRKTNGSQAQVTVQDVRDALRRYDSEKMEKVYSRAVKAVGRELEFSSARHLSMGLWGFMFDAFHTVYEPAKQALQSPIAEEVVEEQTGKKGSLVDYVTSRIAEETSKKGEKEVQAWNQAMGLLKRGEAYVQAITEYCQQTGQSPDHVLQSKKDMLEIMEKVYGSFNAYVTEKEKSIKSRSAVEALEKLEALPLEFMVPVLLEHRAGVDMEVLLELGVDPGFVGRVAQMYVRDVAKFGKAFLEETRKYEAKELKQYKQLAQQR